MLLDQADYFALRTLSAAKAVPSDVVTALADWKVVALSADIGLTCAELQDFAPAFEHEAMQHGRQIVLIGVDKRRAKVKR